MCMWLNQEIIWNITSKLEPIVTLVNMGGLIRDFHFLLYILFKCSQHIYITFVLKIIYAAVITQWFIVSDSLELKCSLWHKKLR